MKKLIVAVGMIATGLAAVSAETEAVTLEGLQKEIRELKAEIRGLRQDIRIRGDFAARMPRPAGTNDLRRVNVGEREGFVRPPADPKARKAWFEARRREHEARLAERKAKASAAAKGQQSQPKTTSSIEQTTKDNNK